jgi:hypothetical protein
MSTLDLGDAWAGAALFLASPLSSCGRTIVVDGGSFCER